MIDMIMIMIMIMVWYDMIRSISLMLASKKNSILKLMND